MFCFNCVAFHTPHHYLSVLGLAGIWAMLREYKSFWYQHPFIGQSHRRHWEQNSPQFPAASRVVQMDAVRQTIKQYKDSLKTDLRTCSICLQLRETIAKHAVMCLFKQPLKVAQSGHSIDMRWTEWKSVGRKAECKGVPCSPSPNMPLPFRANWHLETLWQCKHLWLLSVPTVLSLPYESLLITRW